MYSHPSHKRQLSPLMMSHITRHSETIVMCWYSGRGLSKLLRDPNRLGSAMVNDFHHLQYYSPILTRWEYLVEKALLMQLRRNSDCIVKGDVMASEQNVTRLTKRLKCTYSQHAPKLLTVSSGLKSQIKGWHLIWNPAGLPATPMFNSWSQISAGPWGLLQNTQQYHPHIFTCLSNVGSLMLWIDWLKCD